MTAQFRLTPQALDDLRKIGRYTLRSWGRDQRDRYLRGLDDRFRWLALNPGRGRIRADVCQGYRSFPHGAHVVFYLVQDSGIAIIGIVHQAMDVRSRFGSGEGEEA